MKNKTKVTILMWCATFWLSASMFVMGLTHKDDYLPMILVVPFLFMIFTIPYWKIKEG